MINVFEKFYMKKYLVWVSIITWFSVTAMAQTKGQVPELVDIQTAERLIFEDLNQLDLQVKEIESGGGQVDQNLKQRHELYLNIHNELKSGKIGLTTFLVLAGHVNYRETKADDQAYQDFLDGQWDENYTMLIERLRK